ncbi:hypothetical protein SAMN06296273_1193 [Nitrosomonas ureae]|uniref:Uncharacterized protein n=1 Tax=Nitrosomonas ureae TaxID=44577 RepID=A0A285BX18_9PROT|nr:hypothetical protein [Nitrosomonas ureae]SNX59759.1 hypothetical protein SAMN06296273_1193 [Nitrosomonas ureae]
MKTVFDSNPEFSLTYSHRGISITLSGKILTEAYLSTADSDQDNESLLGLVVEGSLPTAASQAGSLLTQFHPEFEKALGISHSKQVLSRLKSSLNENQAENDTAQQAVVQSQTEATK